jgi:hypothetical protein
MRALDEARSLNNVICDDPRLPKHLQRDARAHNIHNRINRANFVEMHFLRRHAVNLAFRARNPRKNTHSLLLHPRRKLAALNQFTNLRKTSPMLVFMFMPVMFMPVMFVPMVVVMIVVFMIMIVVMIVVFMIMIVVMIVVFMIMIVIIMMMFVRVAVGMAVMLMFVFVMMMPVLV